MSLGPPYFQPSWPTFTYEQQSFDLRHLNEYSFVTTDSTGVPRTILVSFSDHCFTRHPQPGDDPALTYPYSDRRSGYFDRERHELTLQIRDHIARGATGKIYLSEAENLAVITTTTSANRPVYYGIFFNLDKVPKRIPAHLHMRVRTAFPFTTNQPVTHGDVGFARLVTMRINNTYPKRTLGKSREWPPLA